MTREVLYNTENWVHVPPNILHSGFPCGMVLPAGLSSSVLHSGFPVEWCYQLVSLVLYYFPSCFLERDWTKASAYGDLEQYFQNTGSIPPWFRGALIQWKGSAGRSQPFFVTGVEGLEWVHHQKCPDKQLWHISHIWKQFSNYFNLFFTLLHIHFQSTS